MLPVCRGPDLARLRLASKNFSGRYFIQPARQFREISPPRQQERPTRARPMAATANLFIVVRRSPLASCGDRPRRAPNPRTGMVARCAHEAIWPQPWARLGPRAIPQLACCEGARAQMHAMRPLGAPTLARGPPTLAGVDQGRSLPIPGRILVACTLWGRKIRHLLVSCRYPGPMTGRALDPSVLSLKGMHVSTRGSGGSFEGTWLPNCVPNTDINTILLWGLGHHLVVCLRNMVLTLV